MDQLKNKVAYVTPKVLKLSINETLAARGEGSAVSDYGCMKGGAAKGDPELGCSSGSVVSGGVGLNSDCASGAMASNGACSTGAVPLGQFT